MYLFAVINVTMVLHLHISPERNAIFANNRMSIPF